MPGRSTPYLLVGLSALALLPVGCTLPKVQTESVVNAQVAGKIQGDMKVVGDMKVQGRVRTELAPQIDLGPMEEVPLGGPPLQPNEPKVALIDLDGILTNLNHVGPFSVGENPLAVFKEKLEVASADPQVKAVVLRVNSPGGGVAATDLMHHELVSFRRRTNKPVVAVLLDQGAGGAYYLATGCDRIVAIPSSVVGGMGVLLNIFFAREGMGMLNVFDDSIRVGEKIDMGSPVRKLEKEERELLQKMAEGYHGRFKDVVTAARPIKRESELFDGRVMTGPQAQAAGLVDGVGYMDDALGMACRLAKERGATAESLRAVMYRRQGDAARTVYAATANRPIHTTALPLSVPGVDRARLPLFLYMWQAEPTLLRAAGI